MIKFNPDDWLEVSIGEEVQIPAGRLQVRLSAPGSLYITASGGASLAGTETSFDLEIPQNARALVLAPAGVRVFMLFRQNPELLTSFEAQGEVFTNIDQMPSESGAMAEVLRATRQLELKKREMLAEMRAMQAEMAAASSPPVLEPDTFVDDPVQQDQPEQSGEVANEPS